jgi:hypothetical protein
MSEMIERVARALFDDEWPGEPLEEEWDHNRDAWRQKARAAIEAMRQPTQAMKDVYRDAILRESGILQESDGRLERIHVAIIDAALKDAP